MVNGFYVTDESWSDNVFFKAPNQYLPVHYFLLIQMAAEESWCACMYTHTHTSLIIKA